MKMQQKLAACIAVLLLQNVSGLPSLLECATDSTTRLQLLGKAIMAGPVTACPEQCPVNISVTKPSEENGNIKIMVTTNSAMNFAVRVNDAAGTLSSSQSNLASTEHCTAQMYSVGQSVPAGEYAFELALTNKSATIDDIVVTVGFAKGYSPGVTIARHPPLPAASLYRCISNKCVQSKSGVALSTCKQICSGKREFV